MAKTRILAIACQKGGVAKTTTAVTIACGMVRKYGWKVLLVDIDPQANATDSLIAPALSSEALLSDERAQATAFSIKEVLEAATNEEDVFDKALTSVNLVNTDGQTLDMLPSKESLSSIEIHLAGTTDGPYALSDALEQVIESESYDAIVIDCPPSIGVLTINALVCANQVIIPVSVGKFSLQGLNALLKNIEKLQKRGNPDLVLTGILPTMIDNTRASRATLEALQADFAEVLLPAIPRRTAMQDSLLMGMDIFGHEPDNAAAAAYDVLIDLITKE